MKKKNPQVYYLKKNANIYKIFSSYYNEKNLRSRNLFLLKYLVQNSNKKSGNYNSLADYFDKYQAFCFELSSDSVLKGDLNFNYK